MKKIITSIILAVTLTGCATSGGKQLAYQNSEFATVDTNGDGIPDAAGTLTVTRTFDPLTGMLLSETRTLTHVLENRERDNSRLGAKGLLATQAVGAFEHSRTGFTGSSSTSGVKRYSADPDAEAIGAAGTAAGNVIGEALKKAVVPTP